MAAKPKSAEVSAAGGQGVAIQADVADEDAVEALFAETQRRFGGVDVVVPTAGQMGLAPLVDLNLDDLDRQHRINIRGTFVVSQQAVRRLRGVAA